MEILIAVGGTIIVIFIFGTLGYVIGRSSESRCALAKRIRADIEEDIKRVKERKDKERCAEVNKRIYQWNDDLPIDCRSPKLEMIDCEKL